MITLCGAARLWDSCREALALHAPDAVIARFEVEDGPGWWREISARWTGTEDLLLVEQDIAIHAGVLPALEACAEPWCVFPFPIPGDWGRLQDRGIGCARFTAAFQRAVPVPVIEAQGGSCWECLGTDPRCWRHIDGRISDAARLAGFAGPHVHWPPVMHRDVEWAPGL